MQSRREPGGPGKQFWRGPITTPFRLKHAVIFRQLEDRGLEPAGCMAGCMAVNTCIVYIHVFFSYEFEHPSIVVILIEQRRRILLVFWYYIFRAMGGTPNLVGPSNLPPFSPWRACVNDLPKVIYNLTATWTENSGIEPTTSLWQVRYPNTAPASYVLSPDWNTTRKRERGGEEEEILFCLTNKDKEKPHNTPDVDMHHYTTTCMMTIIIGVCGAKLTRKPCYRKDDRAVRPIYTYKLFTLILFTLTVTILCVDFDSERI